MSFGNYKYIFSIGFPQENCQSMLEHCTPTQQSSQEKNIQFDCQWSFYIIMAPHLRGKKIKLLDRVFYV